MAGIVTTNNDGGKGHTPEKLAMVTARQLFDFDPNTLDSAKLAPAQKLLAAIQEALIPHHAKVQSTEREILKEKGSAHLDTPHDPLAAAQAALADIQAAAKGTPWESEFQNPEIVSGMTQVIGNWFATSQHIERQYHCHRNPTDPVAKAWLAAVHPPAATAA